MTSRILEIDLANQSTIASAAKTISNEPLDMLINVAGIYYLHMSEISNALTNLAFYQGLDLDLKCGLNTPLRYSQRSLL